jgi:hypothetical protein
VETESENKEGEGEEHGGTSNEEEMAVSLRMRRATLLNYTWHFVGEEGESEEADE